MTLSVVNTELGDQLSRLFAFHVFGNRFQLHYLGYLSNCCHHRFRDSIIGNIADETTVDFQRIDIEILQIGERAQASTEVI